MHPPSHTPRKRVSDSTREHPSPKRNKYESEINKAVESVQNSIPPLQEVIPQLSISPQEKDGIVGVLASWKIVCNTAQQTGAIWSTGQKSMFDHRLPNTIPLFVAANIDYDALVSLLTKLLASLPEPSVFAHDWPSYQGSIDARLLCLRPPTAHGLPLRLLHDVFGHYLINVAKPLPTTSAIAKAAFASATRLCATMANSFFESNHTPLQGLKAGEKARRKAFFDSTENIFGVPTLEWHVNPSTDLHSGFIDAAFFWEDIPVLLAELKVELGTSGDAYMRIVRCYDLAVKLLQVERDAEVCAFVEQGAPMFLLCVIGPVLLVAGGFFDNNKVVVEPLGDICIMFEDDLNERQDKLAHVLYALKKGVDEIKEVAARSSSATFPPSTPRVYTNCKLYSPSDSPTGTLTFTKKLVPNSRLLFAASLSVTSPDHMPVFVKVASGNYGEEVHHLLASNGLAPRLIAYADPDGAPKAYVMEYLQHPDWISLFDFLEKTHTSSTSMSFIRSSIDLVLKLLEENGSVHGDLRSNNIMVKVSANDELIVVDNKAVINVIDFDWAGKAGEVYYPVLRNESITGMKWPGEAAGAIELGHDCFLVNSWLKE